MAKEKEYMSYNDKVALSQVVENLPLNEHPNIFRIVTRDPTALVDCEDDTSWTYVYFDLLRPSTLRQLENYLASRGVNTQSEIQENNPDLVSEEKSAEPSEENPDVEKKEKSAEPSEENPDVEKKETSAESSKGDDPDSEKEKSAATSPYTDKLRSNKGAKEAKSGSIKARLRRSSKKSESDPGTSKQ